MSDIQIFIIISGFISGIVSGILSAAGMLAVIGVKIEWLRRDLERLDGRVTKMEARKWSN